jgi:hypothetical protein
VASGPSIISLPHLIFKYLLCFLSLLFAHIVSP